MKKIKFYVVAFVLFSMNLVLGTNVEAATQNTVSILESSGWLESAFVSWESMSEASGYNVYYKLESMPDTTYQQLDDELIRQYPGYFRADVLGLEAGSYVIKIVPIIDGVEVVTSSAITKKLDVLAHIREGFAFSQESPMKTASGGYNDNGMISNQAQIVYITADTINTVQTEVITNRKGETTLCTGLVDILAKREKGYDNRPLIIRMIGQIKGSDISGLNSNGYLQIKGNTNITFEGVGDDATVYGWGFLIRASSNIEVRNIGIMMFPDDAISLDTNNVNIWVHNNDIFYGAAGSDADQVKGDGSADVKGNSTYVTLSYNHFYDSGKVSLCGMSDTEEFFVTYHHNWFDHSDSRHPRIRVGTVHIYNNYFDGNSKYGVGITKGGSAFVEANDFRKAKYPMLISLQGSDISGGGKGNFSNEAGGMIKAYNNTIVGETRLVYAQENDKQFDAYLATTRDELVPSQYKTVSGGYTYNNFDTNKTMYEYTPHSPKEVRSNVTMYAGRVNGGDFDWTFTSAEDTSYSVNKELMKAIQNYQSQLVSVGGNSTVAPVEPDQPEPIPPVDPEPIPPVDPGQPDPTPPVNPDQPDTGQQTLMIHNFTNDNKESSFFNITGSLSNSKGIVYYNELELMQCLKVDSTTRISFTSDTASILTLVFNEDFNKAISIDGEKYLVENGILTIELTAGEHIITKGDTANLFYISLAKEVEQVTTIQHNFTTEGLTNEFFEMVGNLSSTKGTVEYHDKLLTQCLKMDSAATIKFTTTTHSMLTLVFNPDFNKTISIDGIKHQVENGLLTIDLLPAEHTIMKGDTSHLYYINLVME